MKPNLDVPEEVQDAGHIANRTAQSAASSRWMTLLARLGYVSKGVVYLIIGWLAVQLAIGAAVKLQTREGYFRSSLNSHSENFYLLSLP